jgi:hypothetical protein
MGLIFKGTKKGDAPASPFRFILSLVEVEGDFDIHLNGNVAAVFL